MGRRPTSLAVIVALGCAVPCHTAQPARPEPFDPRRLIALDSRWVASFGTPVAAPAGFDQEHGYLPLKSGELIAVDLQRGSVRWKIEIATELTPATGDGLVFVAAENALVALEQRTGQTIWKTAVDGRLAAPLRWEAGWLLTGLESGELIAIRAVDGEIQWRQPLGAVLVVPPAVARERLYTAVADGRLICLELETGAQIWSHSLSQEVTGITALDDQLLVGTKTNLVHSFAVDRSRLRWTQRAGADIAGAPIADERRIYFAALDNVLRALDRRSGNLRWSRNLSSRPVGGPLLAGDVVLMPFVTPEIAAYRAETGAEAFTLRAVGELGALPFVRELQRATAPLLISMSRTGALQGFAPRIEPAPGPLSVLPGIKVAG